MAIDLDTIIQPDALPALPAPTQPPHPRQPWLWRLAQLLSAYLPIVLMALLALGTWWLVKNTPRPEAERGEAALRHEPDYLMQDVVLQRFAPDGRLRVQVVGTQMRHYPDDDTLEIDAVTIRAWSPNGDVTQASARRAVANGDASEVQLLGDARVVREGVVDQPRVEFEGEVLQAFLTTERVRSHLPVRMRQGSNEFFVGTLDYDHLARSARFGAPVRARLEPPKR